ncbi:heterokaryon incompatibility protein-domain-containing protein [Hypoxylon fuscum]|nr:heterokaryon incompatibility protein-domain-containing protein [Hypoxylon fuscum]
MTDLTSDSLYEYENLPPDELEGPWIRLFKVRVSAEPTGPVEITIRHAALKQLHDPKFWGLSYVWGQASDDVPLTVVDTDGLNKKWLPVRKSLYNLLFILRARVSEAPQYGTAPLHEFEFWADRICINQNNLEERGYQVSLMGEIYWHAYGIHIWLGQDPGGLTTKAFAEIKRYGDGYWWSRNDEHRFPFLNQSQIEKLDNDAWRAIAQLLEFQWFERVWILQEVGLGNKAIMW